MLTKTSASFFQKIGRGSHTEVFSELHEQMPLVHLHCTSFCFRGSLVTHSKLVQRVTENLGQILCCSLQSLMGLLQRSQGQMAEERRQMGIAMMTRSWCLLQGFKERTTAEFSLWMLALSQGNVQSSPNSKRNGSK